MFRARKRALGTQLVPPAHVLNLWTPLLDHIQSLHPDFRAILVSRIVSRLTSQTDTRREVAAGHVPVPVSEPKADVSCDFLLAAWANWLVCIWPPVPEEAEDGRITREDIILSLTSTLGPRSGSTVDSQKGCGYDQAYSMLHMH